jgi:glyoxylase-like metal-dependent hydrolase (beta-lactamase superfamily II)
VGTGAISVIDPASPDPTEQARLAISLKQRLDQGDRLERIILTHHHRDHVGGVEALRRFCTAQGLNVPVCAHPITAKLLAGAIAVDEPIEDGDTLICGELELEAHFTPGHAPGHLVFQDLASRAIIAGDMVAGIGTILIEPHDGDLALYLDSLGNMRTLEPSVLLPAHGPPLEQADAILAFYIAHRHQRTEQIRQALSGLGEATPMQIAPIVYHDIPQEVHPLAAQQIHSHLRWMKQHGMVMDEGSEASWHLVTG